MPKCPRCGAEMVIRTARRGKNKGNQFYGCSNYPRCKYTLNINEEPENVVNPNNDNGLVDEYQIPRFLSARARFKNYQTRFYETLAIPIELMDEITNENIDKQQLGNFNQWRLDYPIKANFTINDINKQVLLVAHKILNRGRITLPSPFIENKYRKYFKITNFKPEKDDINNYNNLTNPNQKSNIWYDGRGTEQKFYQETLFDILGPYYKKFVIPQVHFSSLIDKENLERTNQWQRVDFLISTPNNNIVVELDDDSHNEHESRDNNRDNSLTEAGFQIVRIKNNEIRDKQGENLNTLKELLKNEKIFKIKKLKSTDKYLLTTKLIHQLQITILESIISGFIDSEKEKNIYFDASSVLLSKKDLKSILKSTINDLSKLIKKLSNLYGVEINLTKIKLSILDSENETNGIIISFNENLSSNLPKFIIQDISFPSIIAYTDRTIKPAKLKPENIEKKDLKYFLYYIFRHNKFLEGQLEAITRTLIGKDTIVLLPTGAGKSVAFQLAAMLLPGVTIVIDPIIALIDDQIENLFKAGINRTIGITSQIKNSNIRSKIINIFSQGEYLFCYVAPERFQTEEFRSALITLKQNTPISLIAIDEAHCVSEWGHDFRTSYLNIGRISREYCKSENQIPPLLALTGTASSSVLKDVQRELQIKDFDAIITPKTFDRKEIHFSVFSVSSNEKYSALKGILKRNLPNKFNISSSSFFQINGKKTNSGLLFCPHVGGSYGVVENANKISSELGINTKYYGGKRPKNWNNNLDWNIYKQHTAKDYKNNKFPLLVATKSFGMGIDKSNIRYTIHFGIPNSIEAFYQEVGRAGRDRKKAEGIIIISNDNPERTNKLLDPDTTPELINRIMNEERDWNSDDDITRAIWFHSKAFKGIENEIEDIKTITNKIGNMAKIRKFNLTLPHIERNSIEKGLHRLIILGIVGDYTIDYSNNEFQINLSGIGYKKIIDNYAEYVAGYNKGRVVSETNKLNEFSNQDYSNFIISACEILIRFIYDTIEKGRRRALREMLSLAETSINKNSDKIIREKILRYLESTYSEEILDIINETKTFYHLQKLIEGYEESRTGEIIGGIRSPKDAMEIRGQTARYLESTPDHPGLLFLRALSELYCKDYDFEIFLENILAAINFSFERYDIDKKVVYNNVIWILNEVHTKRNSIYLNAAHKIIYNINDMTFAELMIMNRNLSEDMLYIPSVYLFSNISNKAINILKK